LLQEKGSYAYWGVAGSEFARVEADGVETFGLLKPGDMLNPTPVWPMEGANCDRCQGGTDHLLVAIRKDGKDALYKFGLRSRELVELKGYQEGWDLLAYSEAVGTAVLLQSDRSGTHLWVSDAAGELARSVLQLNVFLSGVAEGEARGIRYRAVDGAELNACLILPINYVPGTAYPLVTFVYPGVVYGESCSLGGQAAEIDDANFLNLQLFAAHGYAVLLPSMPVAPTTHDPYCCLINGVLPAVDKAIELGFADPHKLGLVGHSFGGFAVLGLITQTKRFQAAIALSGAADFVSSYGTFSASESTPVVQMWRMSWAETGQGNFGVPLLKDPLRYIQNSPLFFADRVETPVLIVQGDLDTAVPPQQGEEFFTALFRQNKRAQFVRYFGEGHGLESPANIRDFWERTYRWFDEFLAPREASGASSQPRENGF
jgi:dipeptidyl aminopeptidase/acylaminoacyl peptidase